MVVFNYSGEEINAKIVYYGPGLSGKTTNLEFIYSKMPADVKGKMVSMKTRTDRTLFFDFLPLELGEINGYRTRLLLYTVPGQVYYNATRKLVLKGADAVVFVADSSRAKLKENIESLRNLEENLNEHGMTLDSIPWVIQYNKRDLNDAMEVKELEEHINLLRVPSYEASAIEGDGVYETFQAIARILYTRLKQQMEQPEGAVRSVTPASGQRDREQSPGSSVTPVEVKQAEAQRAGQEGVDVLSDVVDAALREVDDSKRKSQATPKAAARSESDPSAKAAHPAAGPSGAETGQDRVSRREATKPRQEKPRGREMPASRVVTQASAPPGARQASATERKRDIPIAPEADGSSAQEGRREKAVPRDVKQAPPPHEVVEHRRSSEAGSTPDSEDTIELDLQPEKPVSIRDAHAFQSASKMGEESELGRVVELDDESSPAGEDEESREFITDPCQPMSASEDAGRRVSDRQSYVAATDGSPLQRTDELTFTIPVLISPSQVRRTIPLKLVLEIRVVDDES